MLETNHTIAKLDRDRIWKKYCGFLDISIEQFMAIQEALLLNQFTNLANCHLSQKIIGKKMPCSVEEFRNKVPLTTYDDYLPELNAGNEKALPEFPQYWAQTSGGTEIPR